MAYLGKRLLGSTNCSDFLVGYLRYFGKAMPDTSRTMGLFARTLCGRLLQRRDCANTGEVSSCKIAQRLWSPDTFVDFDQSLNKLRQARNDNAENPRFVATAVSATRAARASGTHAPSAARKKRQPRRKGK